MYCGWFGSEFFLIALKLKVWVVKVFKPALSTSASVCVTAVGKLGTAISLMDNVSIHVG